MHHVCRSEDNLQELGLSFHVGPREPILSSGWWQAPVSVKPSNWPKIKSFYVFECLPVCLYKHLCVSGACTNQNEAPGALEAELQTVHQELFNY